MAPGEDPQLVVVRGPFTASQMFPWEHCPAIHQARARSLLVAKGRVIRWGSPFRPGQPANSPLHGPGGAVRLWVASHHRGVPVTDPQQANFLFARNYRPMW